MIDYNKMGEIFDRYLPLIQPVGEAILGHLPTLPEDSQVLDVACGTGEPGLTLARRCPRVSLLGVDGAEGMVEVARAKAAREGLANARFQVMSLEMLDCPVVDAVVSRFGLLLFGDAARSARELARVLRPGGSFSLAVWDDMNLNTLVHTVLGLLRQRVAAELFEMFTALEALAAPGVRDGLLRDAGLVDFDSEMFKWTMDFPSEEALRVYIFGPGIFSRFTAELSDAEEDEVWSEAQAAFASFRHAHGGYKIPHTCRLLWGQSELRSICHAAGCA